ncbi:unnamed protein product [Paramecium pentaurelia]|uniref:Uncharacterized protein n=1 Tax=Paramecium pentaurelia TaxID=43138 RepID=A0A8S1Y7V9_9CILI|nr:unnamed protein product [Paramecium pentaurelia]
MTDLCKNCKHKQLRSRMIGKKFSSNILNQIQQIKSPRNIETPYINVIEYLQSIHQKKEEKPKEIILYHRLKTHTSKQKTELQVDDAAQTTSRLDQFPLTQYIPRGAVANKIMSSAFYKMKRMCSYSREESKRKKIEIGPMFNQVSKYVQPMRPGTVRSVNSKIDERLGSTLISARQELLRHSKSEMHLRLPVSNKLSEVQSLMKRE